MSTSETTTKAPVTNTPIANSMISELEKQTPSSPESGQNTPDLHKNKNCYQRLSTFEKLKNSPKSK